MKRYIARSVKTDDQLNALEALETAISKKSQKWDLFITRQFYLTSDCIWGGKIEKYANGHYIKIKGQGTQSGFQAFVDSDGIIWRRRPGPLTPLIGWYEVEGNEGIILWMSTLHSTTN